METIKGMLAEYLSKAKGKKASKDATVIFGMKAAFGGGKSSCFALVYDSVDCAKKHEPKHRLMQAGHLEKPSVVVGRKQRKEKKNREKKFRGTRKEKRVAQANLKHPNRILEVVVDTGSCILVVICCMQSWS